MVKIHCPSSDIGVELAEAREVGEVQELLCRYVHPLEVQREVQAQHTCFLEWVLAQRHIVAVGARGSTEACVRLFLHGTKVVQGDIVRKVAVGAEEQLTCSLQLHRQVNVGNHTTSVDTSIGTPSPDDSDGGGGT